MMGLGMGVGMLLLLLFWCLLIAGSLWLVTALFTSRERSQRPPGGSAQTLSPRGILDQRYARGEIGAEEYQLVRRDLEG